MGISAERAKYSGITICGRVLYCGMTTTKLMSELGKIAEILGTEEIRVNRGPQKYPKLSKYEITLRDIRGDISIANVHVLPSNKESGGTVEAIEFYVLNWDRVVQLTGANERVVVGKVREKEYQPFMEVYYGGINLLYYHMRDIDEQKEYEQVTYRYNTTLYAGPNGEVSIVRIYRRKRR